MGIRKMRRQTVFFGLLFVGLLFLFNTGNEATMQMHIQTPAIVVHSVGGLGNQFFKFATSYALARQLEIPTLYVVIPAANENPLNPFTFNNSEFLTVKLITSDEWDAIVKAQDASIYEFICENFFFHRIPKSFAETHILYLKDDCHSGIYFEEYEDEVRKLFSFSSEFVESLGKSALQKLKNTIESAPAAVALHIERGDNTLKENWLPPISYFQQAISTMNEELPDEAVNFFIFSDDIDYVKKNLKLNSTSVYQQKLKFNFVSKQLRKGVYELTSLEEFYLMTLCRNMILSNSAFSWWAAFLISPSDRKVVIGPTFHPEFLKQVQENHSRTFKTFMLEYKYQPGWIGL